ncbi:MAG TPA: methyltransferase domain-containing protein [Phycisphaerae bacterium]|nr:methyltransferase domain-containing protein [Phycisphaerae bacterium]HRY69779.1 methyltransferase domain-containing protein [Phycisphaerae bacterium]HSA29255.1 methyltransferase domain-containing protein [Phycisphaerae bacterium]
MPNPWDERYLQNDTPWERGQRNRELARVLEEQAIQPCRALELGCGTGNDCLWLASLGFDIIGVDISPTALERARQKAVTAGATCRFVLADVFKLPDLGEPFGLIVDIGCYHAVRKIDEAAYVAALHQLLAKDGLLLVLCGNAKENTDPGPPRVSEGEIRAAFADRFKIRHLREFRLDPMPDERKQHLFWSVLLGSQG